MVIKPTTPPPAPPTTTTKAPTTTTTTTTLSPTTSTTTSTTTQSPPPSTIFESISELISEDPEDMVTNQFDVISSVAVEDGDSTKLEVDEESLVSKVIEGSNSPEDLLTTTTAKPKRNRKKNQPTEEKHLSKRSLRFHRRESIKIIPGDYRNFDGFDYRRYYNQKWKRSIVSPESSGLISRLRSKQSTIISSKGSEAEEPLHHLSIFRECCPKKVPTCLCRNDCQRPVCVNPKQILVQIKPGNSSQPGQCCPEYTCVDSEPDCSAYKRTEKIFWTSKCHMCQCMHGTKFCNDVCPSAHIPSDSNCFSESALEKKLYKNGETWKEDDCTECECENGKRSCLISHCMDLHTCKVLKKVPGQCCPICDDDNLKLKTTTTISTLAISINASRVEEITTTELASSLSTTLCPPLQPAIESKLLDLVQEHIVPVVITILVLLLVLTVCIVLFCVKLCKRPKESYLSIPNGDSNSSQNHHENGINGNISRSSTSSN